MFRQLRLIGALTVKDWKLFLADRRAAVLCFAVPIVLASAFGIIFDRPSQQMGTFKLPLIVVVEDDSDFTRKIVHDLQQSEFLEIRLADRATAEEAINARSGSVAAIIPQGFGQETALRLQRGNKPVVELLHHPLSAMESHWAEGALTEVVMRQAAHDFLAPLGMNAPDLDRPFAVERHAIPAEARHPFNSHSHSFSGMTLQYLLFWGMECGLLLLRERRCGIWDRVKVAPVPLTTALLGRACSTLLIALLQIAATFGFGHVVFGVAITGSPAAFLVLAVAVSLLAAGLGLFVASVGKTEASARSVFIVVILAVSMLGGLWLPAFLLPKWIQDWSLVLPTSWAMRGLDGVTWQGQTFGALWPSLLAVNLFAVAFLGLALVRFHWCEKHRKCGEIA